MTKKDTQIIISDEVVMSKIYVIRDVNVMIDRDLAELYGVETKYPKQLEAFKHQEMEQKNRKRIGFKS